MSEKSWELTEKQKRDILEQEKNRNEMQDLFEYNRYIMQQERQFEKIMIFINNLINELKDYGKISEYTELRARIKAPKSALKNDPIKALDDAFGMEVIAVTEHEIEEIMNEMEKWLTVQKAKDHDKPNGYKAKHRIMTFKYDKIESADIEPEYFEIVPMIEFQFKTFETLMRSLKGDAEHTIYKGETKEKVQERYDNDEYDVFDIPTMWVSKDGNIRMLTPEETLKKMYPFLRMKKNKDKTRGEE